MRELASNLIAYLKKHYTYYWLSQITGLSPSVLNRYAKRVVVPNYERSIELYNKLKPIIAKHIRQIIDKDDWSILYSPTTLDVLSTVITFKMAGQRVTKILAFEEMSPLAISTAIKIGAPFVIITQTRNLCYSSWLSIDYRIGGIWLSYFIPRDSLRKNDSILYIDTIMTPIKDDVLTKLEQLMDITIEHKLILKNLMDELRTEST
ncbi:MAG: hypothetical protein QXK93_07590 [Candidatus Bathyarchaeia archaeon]